MSIEDQLRRALARVEPDTDIETAVLARLGAPAPRRARPQWPWALAASVVAAIGLALFVGQQRDRARAEVASRQLAYALELTSRELESIHQRVNRTIEETGS
jgi:hypothetical protein